MDRWALKQAIEMLEAKAEAGQLSAEAERRVRELLARGNAGRALKWLAGQTDDEFDYTD